MCLLGAPPYDYPVTRSNARWTGDQDDPDSNFKSGTSFYTAP